jgi:UDPglucose 6-dehydrogenase
MRIAYFTDTYNPEVNGVTNTLSKLGAYLNEKHIRHTIFAPAYEYAESFPRRENRYSAYRNLYRFKGVKTPFSPESRLAFPAFWKIDEICDSFKPDLVHVSTELGIGFRGMRYAVTRSLPLVMSYHTNYGDYLRYFNLEGLKQILEKYLAWFYRFAHRVLVPSLHTLETLFRRQYRNPDIWSRGIDTALFNPGYRNKELRTRIGKGKFIFLYVGRLSPEKGLDMLLYGATEFERRFPGEAVFVLTGDGPYAETIRMLKKGALPIYEPGLDAVVERNVRAGRLVFTADYAPAITESTVVFIAVGTPSGDDGGADLSQIEAAVRNIGALIETYTVVVSKSTVPIGTGRRVQGWIGEELEKRGKAGGTGNADNAVEFDVVSNPEFLREGSAVYDFTHPDRIVIGADSKRARRIMKNVYRSLYLSETPYIETPLESAEMIKYASNAFLAVKITFINEIANLCEKTGADIQDVALAMGRDGRIGAKFLHPGPGYGGSCFPKDTSALAKTGRKYHETQSIVEAAIEANEAQKIRAAKKVEAVFAGSLQGKTLALLRLAFKPNTGDTRESPAIFIGEYLIGKGAKLQVYDPAAMDEAKKRLAPFGDTVYFAGDEYDAIAGASALLIVTEWNQFRNIDLYRVKELLAQPYFFDFRNIYKRKEVEAAGLCYFGTGKPARHTGRLLCL